MGVGEPLGAGVVESGQGALLDLPCRRFVAGGGASWVAGNRFLHPFHPFGRVEPAVAEGDQAAGGLGDGDGAGVFGVCGGGDVGGEAVGEGEGFEGCGGGVAGAVLKAGAQPQ